MSDSCLEPGDARLVELTLAVHDIVLTNLILSQGKSDRLGSRNLKIFLAVASFFEQISVHGCVSIKLPLDIFGLLLWVVG